MEIKNVEIVIDQSLQTLRTKKTQNSRTDWLVEALRKEITLSKTHKKREVQYY